MFTVSGGIMSQAAMFGLKASETTVTWTVIAVSSAGVKRQALTIPTNNKPPELSREASSRSCY